MRDDEACRLQPLQLFEHFGLAGATARPADAGKLLGVCLTVAGVWLVVR